LFENRTIGKAEEIVIRGLGILSDPLAADGTSLSRP
jgi:hypothetical protein